MNPLRAQLVESFQSPYALAPIPKERIVPAVCLTNERLVIVDCGVLFVIFMGSYVAFCLVAR